MNGIKQFSVFLNPYYWRTALLIARCNLSRQYRNSFLGMLWTLIQPLSVVIIYSIVMPMVMKFPVENYVVYLLCTLPLWTLISASLIGCSASLLSQAETLKHCLISSTVFPVADVLRNTYTYAIAFTTMYAFALLIGFPGSWYALLVPLYLIPILLTVMALSVGIAFVAPFIRDIGDALVVLLNMVFWFSAIVFPVSMLPDWAQTITQWNPFYILMYPLIALVYEHHLPEMEMMARLFFLLALSVLIGYGLYRKCRRNFVYYM